MLQQKSKNFSLSNNFLHYLVLINLLFAGCLTIVQAATEQDSVPLWKQSDTNNVVYSPSFLLSDALATDPSELNGYTRQLKEIGYENGITFEGAETTHEVKLDFPLPSDTVIEDANISLKFRVSPLLNDLANLQLTIDDYPLEQVRLNSQGVDQTLLAEIPKRFLRGGNARITIRAALPISEDRCLDTRINGSNLHIDPSSSFTVHYSGEIGSLRDAWTLLPNKVILSVPDRTFNPSEFNAAWEMLDNLQRQGKEVEIVTFPTPGHIVIAKHVELEQLLRQELLEAQHEESESFFLEEDIQRSTMALVNSPVRSLIAILDPQQTGALQLMNNPWRKLGISKNYRTFPVEYADNLSGLGSIPAKEIALELKLSDLGADTTTRYVRSSIKWNMVLDPFRIPAGTRPNRLFLNVFAPPPPGKPPFEFYVYLNDIMVHATRLGEKQQQISIPLPQKYQEPYNRIQIQVLNIEPLGDCRADLAAFPVQILPDSSLIVERDMSLPEHFSDLPVYFADNFDIYLPASFLQTPVTALPYVSELTSKLPVPFKTRIAEFIETGQVVSPVRPFVAIGDVALDNLDSPVKFDQGKIHVVDRNKNPLLKVDDLPDVTIAQLVTSHKQHGLWLRSSESNIFPDVNNLFLNHDDVAFADQSGLLFTMNSLQPTLASTYYPEARDWLALLGKYRFWLFVIGWLALTLIIFYLFRRARHHRESQGNY